MGIMSPPMRGDAPIDPGPRCQIKGCPHPRYAAMLCRKHFQELIINQAGRVRRSVMDRERDSKSTRMQKNQRGARSLSGPRGNKS